MHVVDAAAGYAADVGGEVGVVCDVGDELVGQVVRVGVDGFGPRDGGDVFDLHSLGGWVEEGAGCVRGRGVGGCWGAEAGGCRECRGRGGCGGWGVCGFGDKGRGGGEGRGRGLDGACFGRGGGEGQAVVDGVVVLDVDGGVGGEARVDHVVEAGGRVCGRRRLAARAGEGRLLDHVRGEDDLVVDDEADALAVARRAAVAEGRLLLDRGPARLLAWVRGGALLDGRLAGHGAARVGRVLRWRAALAAVRRMARGRRGLLTGAAAAAAGAGGRVAGGGLGLSPLGRRRLARVEQRQKHGRD